MSDIATIQNTIIQEFATVSGDRELMLNYLTDLGAAMPPLAEKYKTARYLVPGCLSKVWLLQKEEAGCIQVRADSNAAITKGLVSLLVRIFSNQPIRAIAEAKLFFAEQAGLHGLIGVQRRSGFEQMVRQIRSYATHLLIKNAGFPEK